MRILLALLLAVCVPAKGALYFNSASSEYGAAVAPATLTAAYPMTIACWGTIISAGTLNVLATVNSLTTQRNSLYSDGAGALAALSSDGTSSSAFFSIASAGVVTNQWFHIAGVFESATMRRIYINGVFLDDDTTSKAQSPHSVILAGARILGGTTGSFHNGGLCEYAVWQAILPAGDIAALASRAAAPTQVSQPDKLVAYYQLLDGLTTHTHDWRGGSMSLSNTPTVVVHPKIVAAP